MSMFNVFNSFVALIVVVPDMYDLQLQITLKVSIFWFYISMISCNLS